MQEGFSRLLAVLPPSVAHEIGRMAEGQADFEKRLSEIRLRVRHNASVVLDGRNILLPAVLDAEQVNATLTAFCDGSVYAYDASLAEGYLTAFGFRVGVGGRAVTEGGRVTGLADPTSLCIRIPHRIAGAGSEAARLFYALGGRRGILVYSPPGVGKTTLLCDLARILSQGPRAVRVVLVDTRGELYDPTLPAICQIDVLRGYPLGKGIEIATRTLAPEVILCDEIGSPEDAAAILSVAGAGVPVIASAHGGSVGELLARETIQVLAARGIFSAYLGIARHGTRYSYTVDYATVALAAQKEREAVCFSV